MTKIEHNAWLMVCNGLPKLNNYRNLPPMPPSGYPIDKYKHWCDQWYSGDPSRDSDDNRVQEFLSRMEGSI